MYTTNRSSRGFDLGSELGYKKVREAFGGPPEDGEEEHIKQAKAALLKAAGRLNDWEVSFCESMIHVRWPPPKQLNCLETLVAKTTMRAKSRRGRGAPR